MRSSSIRPASAASALALLAFALSTAAAPAQQVAGAAWDHAPIGAAGMRLLETEQWALTLRYERVTLGGLRDGSSDLSRSEVAASFPVVPVDMVAERTYLGVAFPASESLSLLLEAPYVRRTLEQEQANGQRFTTRSSGLGDTVITVLPLLQRWGDDTLHLRAGISLPTGAIDEVDDTPFGADQRLPYPLQIGSGTIDLLPGIVYQSVAQDWGWGGQAVSTLRLGENDHDYALGHRLDMSLWGERRWTRELSLSLRLAGSWWGDVRGADPLLDPTVSPISSPGLQGGRRIDLLVGLGFQDEDGFPKDSRVAIEVGAPIYQDLHGPQLKQEWVLFLGLQLAL